MEAMSRAFQRPHWDPAWPASLQKMDELHAAQSSGPLPSSCHLSGIEDRACDPSNFRGVCGAWGGPRTFLLLISAELRKMKSRSAWHQHSSHYVPGPS
jgi:hypothetical protein